MSETTHNSNINRKLLDIQRALKPITKDNKAGSGGFSYKFRSISQVMSALKPLLDEYGVLLSTHENMTTTVEHDRGLSVILHQIITFTDSETNEFVTSGGHGQGTDTGDKAVAKARTAAFKQTIFQQFCIPDDSDSEFESPTVSKKLIGGAK